MKLRAALVEPDARSARRLGRLLSDAGYEVWRYPSLGRFLDSLLREGFDALLMDMNMPGMESREMIRALRSSSKTRRMAIIGVSGKPWPKDDVTSAFEAGADEFLFKPLDPELLVARLGSLLQRARAPEAEDSLSVAGITVCPDSRVCRVDDEERRLTRLEFDILLQFIRNPRRVLTRGYLIHALWRSETSRGARAVDRHIHSLRAKLGAYGRLVETLVGIGYRLCDASGAGRRGSGGVRILQR